MSLVGKLVSACACVISVSCTGPQGASVPINTADTTPPVIFSLETVGRQGGELFVSQSSGPVSGSLAATDSFIVAARADDPEGVRQVQILGTLMKGCTNPQTGEGAVGAPGPGDVLAESTETSTTTTTIQRVVSTPVRMADYTCNPGENLSVELVFWATGQNFGGGAVQSDKLTLTFTTP
jgi:hypothetical protein